MLPLFSILYEWNFLFPTFFASHGKLKWICFNFPHLTGSLIKTSLDFTSNQQGMEYVKGFSIINVSWKTCGIEPILQLSIPCRLEYLKVFYRENTENPIKWIQLESRQIRAMKKKKKKRLRYSPKSFPFNLLHFSLIGAQFRLPKIKLHNVQWCLCRDIYVPRLTFMWLQQNECKSRIVI